MFITIRVLALLTTLLTLYYALPVIVSATKSHDSVGFDANNDLVKTAYSVDDSSIAGGNIKGADILIVNTLDGRIHGLQKSDGRLLWSTSSATSAPDGSSSKASMVQVIKQTSASSSSSSSSSSSVDKSGNVALLEEGSSDSLQHLDTSSSHPPLLRANKLDDIIFIPEPAGNGDLYFMTRSSTSNSMSELQKFNISLKDIVDRNLGVREDQFIFTGGKSTSVIALDPATGTILRTFGSSSFPSTAILPQEQCSSDEDEQDQCRNTPAPLTDAIFISKTLYHLQIHSVVDETVLD